MTHKKIRGNLYMIHEQEDMPPKEKSQSKMQDRTDIIKNFLFVWSAVYSSKNASDYSLTFIQQKHRRTMSWKFENFQVTNIRLSKANLTSQAAEKFMEFTKDATSVVIQVGKYKETRALKKNESNENILAFFGVEYA